MSQKFLIVVIAVTLYNGVTYSLNVKRNSDVGLSEVNPSTVLPEPSDHNNKTAEPIIVPAGKTNVSSQQNKFSNPKNVKIQPSVSTETVTADSVVNPKDLDDSKINNTKISDNKNVNQTTEKINHQTTSKSDINQVIDNKSINQNSSSRNADVPSVNHFVNVTTPLPEQKPTVAPMTSLSSNITASNVATTLPVSTTTPHSIAKDNTPAPAQASSGFDGPSFIGGIVLTLGVTAIGFIAFKYYKSGKIDMNYRTL